MIRKNKIYLVDNVIGVLEDLGGLCFIFFGVWSWESCRFICGVRGGTVIIGFVFSLEFSSGGEGCVV